MMLLNIILYFFACFLFNILLSTLPNKYYQKLVIEIKLPKSKKFDGRKHPIYRLEVDDYGFTKVQKWELKYDAKLNLYLILAHGLLPIPTRLLTYGYHEVGSYILGTTLTKAYDTLGSRTLEEYYKSREEEDEHINSLRRARAAKREILNSEFNQNYID